MYCAYRYLVHDENLETTVLPPHPPATSAFPPPFSFRPRLSSPETVARRQLSQAFLNFYFNFNFFSFFFSPPIRPKEWPSKVTPGAYVVSSTYGHEYYER